MIYCDAVTYEDVEEYVVRRWIDKHLRSTCGADVPDDLLAQSPYRRLVTGPDVTPEPWQSIEVEHIASESEPVVTRNPVLVDAPVGEFAAYRKEAINNKRDQLVNDPVATVTLADGRVFQTDPTSLTLMSRAKISADLNGGFAENAIWRAADNTDHPRTTVLFAEISAKEEVRCEIIWYQSWTLKGQIDAIVADTELTDQQKLAAIHAVTWDEPS